METGIRFKCSEKAIKYLGLNWILRREQKLLKEEIKRIRREQFEIPNRNQYDPHIPPPPEHDQELWFRRLEENQIWGKVLGYLTNPSDITSAYFACETFRRHLEERRKWNLLPKIFAILKERRYLFHWFDPNPYYPEDRRWLFSMRLVSKTWKRVMEERLIDDIFLNEDWHLKEINWLGINPSIFGFSPRNLDHVMKTLSLNLNPSLIRIMRLHIPLGFFRENLEPFMGKISEFLDVYGGTIWGLVFECQNYFFGDAINIEKYYNFEILCYVVSRLPQLKALYISLDPEFRFETSEEDLVRFRERLEQSHFPSVPTLKYFEYSLYPSIEYESVIVQILRGCQNLKTVILGNLDGIPHNVNNELRSLSLQRFEAHYNGDRNQFRDRPMQAPLRALRKLGQFQWPLKVLDFWYSISSDEDSVKINASDLFAALNKFHDTLTDLSVHVDWKIENDNRQKVIDLPRLNSFDLTTYDDFYFVQNDDFD